jgi:methionine-rich copper-binding protein CopC
MKIIHHFHLLLLLWITLVAARAHAFLDHADPRVGSTVKDAPRVVTIWFTEELEGAFSKIQVLDAHGREVDKKDSHVDAAHHAMMSVSLPALPPGDYKVVWHTVAIDTHHTSGMFPFTVQSR